MASFQAVVFDPGSQSLKTTQLNAIETLENEVLVSIEYCTICGSDLHSFTGRRSVPQNVILGHEIIGRIDSWNGDQPVDYQGRPLQVGDRVTWTLCASCGKCVACTRGIPQKCDRLFKYGHQSLIDGRPSGGLATHCVLRVGTTIFRVPSELPDAVVCPANCATATVMAAIRLLQEVSEVKNRSILIAGMGMLGLTAAAVCSQMGAERVVAVDVAPDRLELAKKFGATETIVAGSEFESRLREANGKKLVDVALEFSGMTQSVKHCLQGLRTGGALILAGSVFPSAPIELLPEQVVRRLLTIRGVHNYRPEDLAVALDFLANNYQRFPFQSLVECEYDLAQSEEAFRYARDGSPVRVAVRP